jgi:oxalate---CoA ligase
VTETSSTLPSLLADACARHAGRPAIVLPHGAIDFATLAGQFDTIRDGLRARGIGRTDRVGLIAPLSPAAAVMSTGLMCAATAVRLPTGMTDGDLDSAISRLGLRAIAGPADLADPARDAAARHRLPWLDYRLDPDGQHFILEGPASGPAAADRAARPDDIGNISLTSGTTGQSKLVPRTHANMALMLRRVTAALPLPPGSRTVVLMPLFHYGWVHMLRSLAIGGIAGLPGPFETALLPAWLASHRPDWLVVTPLMLEALLAAMPPGATAGNALNIVQVSAAALPAPLRERATAILDAHILDIYGSNEAGTIAMETPHRPAPDGSVGHAIIPVRIAGEQDEPLLPGTPGAIQVPAAQVFPGYLDDDDLNARSFTADGWFRMGDRGVLQADGALTVLGRADDVINHGGEKIDPTEVEAVLLAHPAVAGCAVFPIASSSAGADPAAAVVLAPGATVTPRALRRWLLDRLVPHRVPRRIVFVDDLPRTASGKIRRVDLPGLLDPDGSA